MVDPSQHADKRGFVESILRYIPGFHGYLEKDYRQESDHLAREWLADRLDQGKHAVDSHMLELVNAGQLDQLTNYERVKTKLDGLVNRIRGAVRGYSGFFDFVRVDEQLLDRVYEHDMGLMKDVEALVGIMERLATEPEVTAKDLTQRVEQIDQKFTERSNMLNGIGES